MRLYSPQECMEYWQTRKPIRSGKTIWLSIMRCIEYAIKQDEIARELSNIRCDLSSNDKQIRDEVIDRFMNLCDAYCHFNKDKHPAN